VCCPRFGFLPAAVLGPLESVIVASSARSGPAAYKSNRVEAFRLVAEMGQAGSPRWVRCSYQPSTFANTSGATMVASDSMMYFGVSTLNLPHVIFSLGKAPEVDRKLVVESLIWQNYPYSGTSTCDQACL